MKQHWAETIADNLLRSFPSREEYVLAAGISPSGTVHIGNFRDVITSEAVYRVLSERGVKTRFLFSWDDYDRFRKVPSNVPSEFSQYLGLPYSAVPNPFESEGTYASHFEKEFEAELPKLGVFPEFKYQTDNYRSGKYNPLIIEAMKNRLEIAKIISSFKTSPMSENEMNSYFPLEVYCARCGKDETEITSFEEDSVVLNYRCACGNHDSVNLLENNPGKLVWKVDWPMRWKYEGTCFEPGGKDHSSPGGSFQVSTRIASEVFRISAPIYQPYEFIGLSGLASKMSGSSGINVSPKQLLEIYEPELLRWLFLRTPPTKPFDFCFDSEIIRQYEEFDREKEQYQKGNLDPSRRRALELSSISRGSRFSGSSVPFRQIATFGQITSGNMKELTRIFQEIGTDYDEESIERRLSLSQRWIEKYAPEMRIRLRTEPNIDYFSQMTGEDQTLIRTFFSQIGDAWSLESITNLAYSMPKNPSLGEEENKERQRIFFQHIYQLLLGQERGPRLPTFLISLGRERIEPLIPK